MPKASTTSSRRKADAITNNDYLLTRQAFIDAPADDKTQKFLNYCFAVINQKNMAVLSDREALGAISECSSLGVKLNPTIKEVLTEVKSLRRQPARPEEAAELRWTKFVKQISDLRRRF